MVAVVGNTCTSFITFIIDFYILTLQLPRWNTNNNIKEFLQERR